VLEFRYTPPELGSYVGQEPLAKPGRLKLAYRDLSHAGAAEIITTYDLATGTLGELKLDPAMFYRMRTGGLSNWLDGSSFDGSWAWRFKAPPVVKSHLYNGGSLSVDVIVRLALSPTPPIGP